MTMAPWTKTVTIDSLTLPATIPFIGHELSAGITEAMITVSTFFETLPFQRVVGDVGETYYDDCPNDVSEIARGAKKLGRSYIRDISKTLSTHQPIDATGQPISFNLLNYLVSMVKFPDFLMAHHSFIREMYVLHRANNTAWDVSLELPSGRVLPVYKGVPVFRNDYLNIREIIVGKFDDGTKTRGVAGLIPDAGFIGATPVLSGWHLAFTGGLAIFADDAVASLSNVERF